MRMWKWTAKDGHRMVSIEVCLTAGMSPGNTNGIDIHAVGRTCSIIADWPKEFYEMSRVKKYYSKEELEDENTVRMLNAEEDSLRRVVKQAGTAPRATVEVPLPFPVIETRNPPIKSVTVSETGTRMTTVHLACLYDFDGLLCQEDHPRGRGV